MSWTPSIPKTGITVSEYLYREVRSIETCYAQQKENIEHLHTERDKLLAKIQELESTLKATRESAETVELNLQERLNRLRTSNADLRTAGKSLERQRDEALATVTAQAEELSRLRTTLTACQRARDTYLDHLEKSETLAKTLKAEFTSARTAVNRVLEYTRFALGQAVHDSQHSRVLDAIIAIIHNNYTPRDD